MEIRDELKTILTEVITPIVRDVIAEEVPKAITPPRKRYYTIQEVCAKVGICEASFHNWANDKKLERIRDGRYVKVDADEVDAAIERGELKKYKHKK